ncbi:hypothetical protein [Actinokineospora enzanensis]|uniref:hypothetical protein n=1 Tax=Actinokineospora enzanensis TaxID=155975 RepID=UPI00036EA722|nr:hypothetical protein [Actinokineospora enzanensis]
MRLVAVKCVVERTGDGAAEAAAVHGWFDGSLRTLGAEFRESVLGVEVRDSAPLRKSSLPCGEPGTAFGRLFVTRLVNGKERQTWRAVGSKEWAKFLAEKTAPHAARFIVDYLDEKGRMSMRAPSVHVDQEIHEADGGGGWLLLQSVVHEETFREVDANGAVVEFMRGWAEEHTPVFLECSHSTLHRTEFEEEFLLDHRETLREVREVLRGYGWITVLPREIGDRLGGAEVLRETGAFLEVDRLPDGGYWLRATGTYDEYGMPEVEKVFRAVAPALPAMEPRPERRFPPPQKIMRVNAGDYR